MDEEGIVGPGWSIGDGLGGGMGKLAVHSCHKGVKGIAADEFAREGLRLLFAFGLKELVLSRRHRAILGAHDLKADFNLPAMAKVAHSRNWVR